MRVQRPDAESPANGAPRDPNASKLLPPWRRAGLRYRSQSYDLRTHFGGRVWKVSVDGGFSCPNLDGSIAETGCIFCNARAFSPGRRTGIASITGQIDAGLARITRRYATGRLIAYFQPSTNTYAPVERLREAFNEALAHPNVVGLAVGTRPDCVKDEALDLLAGLASKHWVQLELGLQSAHDRSLGWLGRGHDAACFFETVERCRGRGLRVGAHLILGIPGEAREDIQATARALAAAGLHAVKLHNLYVVRDTPLAALWERGELVLPDRATYASYVVDFLERLPPACVIDRLSGDVPPPYFLGPPWAADKHAVRRAIDDELLRRDAWQGKFCQGDAAEPSS